VMSLIDTHSSPFHHSSLNLKETGLLLFCIHTIILKWDKLGHRSTRSTYACLFRWWVSLLNDGSALLRYLGNLAQLLQAMGRFGEAEPLLIRALDISRSKVKAGFTLYLVNIVRCHFLGTNQTRY
jgi:hypothetical protein